MSNIGIDSMEEMAILINELNQAAKSYYTQGREIMTNYEYDKKYDRLVELEKLNNFVIADSPTQRAGYHVMSELPKAKHETPMLSLDKTKDINELKKWIGNKMVVLTDKLDGCSTVCTYMDGKLVNVVTRGDGYEGTDITVNARQYENLPQTIKYKGKLVVRGESIISYKDFEEINSHLPASQQYKNPRNLCAGTITNLDPSVVKARHVNFIAYECIYPEKDFYQQSLDFLYLGGFATVRSEQLWASTIADRIKWCEEHINENEFPTDGLVIRYEDNKYGMSLGHTAHAFRHSIAYKFADKPEETTLRSIEWQVGKTGQLTPVANFDPIEIEGTTVSKASLHNVSILKGLELGIGDNIGVIKANLIIPQVVENYTRSNTYKIPDECPVCGGKALVKQENDSKVLMCMNPHCSAKLLGKLKHFVSRDAMNIDGLSESTLETLMKICDVRSFYDLYHMQGYKNKLINLDGFGITSVNKLFKSIEKSKNTNLARFIYSLSIPNIGKTVSKQIAKHCEDDFQIFHIMMDNNPRELKSLDGFGEVLYKSITEYWEENYYDILMLAGLMDFQIEQVKSNGVDLGGKVFVITGKLKHFSNRDALVKNIEDHGGKVSGSVSSKVSYLINNDVNSTSGKNKKALELNVNIISEEDYMKMVGE